MNKGGGTRLSASARRAQLIDVGRTVFAERGYEGASVEEIADRAKVSRPIVYEHFGGKDGLYTVIVDREMEYIVRRISEALMSGTASGRIEGATLAFLTYVRDHPEGFTLLTRDTPSGSTGLAISSLLNDLADRVSSSFAESFKNAGYDPKLAPIYAHALMGMVTFVGQWWATTRKPAVEEVAKHISALAWMGLRHLPKRPRAPRASGQ